MIRRTSLRPESHDLGVLKEEARRRGVSLAVLLAEVVQREAAAVRATRSPRVGIVDRRVSIGRSMDGAPEAGASSEFRSG